MQRGDRMKQSGVFCLLNRDIGSKWGLTEILLPADGRARVIERLLPCPHNYYTQIRGVSGECSCWAAKPSWNSFLWK